MKKTLTLIFLAIAFFTSAQEYVNDTFEKGYIKDGQRFRIWEFYNDDKELELKIDFSNGKIYYLKPIDTEFIVQKDYDWVKIKPQVYPIYALGTHNFYKEVRQRLKFPATPRSGKSVSGRAVVMFIVDSLGKARDFQLIEKFGLGTDRNILETMKTIPNAWIPAIYNKKRINTRFILPIIYLSGDGTVPDKSFNQEGTVLKPIVLALEVPAPNPVISTLQFKSGPGYVLERQKGFVEEFEADDQTKIKNGLYQRYTVRDNLTSMIEKGNYKNNKKEGPWMEFLTSTKLARLRGMSNYVKETGNYQNDLKEGIWEEFQFFNWRREASYLTEGDEEDSTSLFEGPKVLKLSARGAYNQGKKTGQWIDFGSNADTVRIYDHSDHVLLRDREISNVKKFNEAQTPLYEGGTQNLNIDFYEHFDFRNIFGFINKDSVYTTFLVTVGADGKVSEAKHMSGATHHLVIKEIGMAWKLCSDWIPAHKDGKPVASSNIYTVSISKKWKVEKNFEAATYSVRVWRANK